MSDSTKQAYWVHINRLPGTRGNAVVVEAVSFADAVEQAQKIADGVYAGKVVAVELLGDSEQFYVIRRTKTEDGFVEDQVSLISAMFYLQSKSRTFVV